MSINGSKTVQSGAPGRIGLILQLFLAESSVNQPPSTRDGRSTAGPDAKS